ncbi:MAG: hypothetical protein ACREO5_00885 [Candidatus Binatia bacterium]
MTTRDFIFPGFLAAGFGVLIYIFRKPAVPATSTIPSQTTNASGALPTTVAQPTTFAVAPPVLSGLPALLYALAHPFDTQSPGQSPQDAPLPSYMIDNVPPDRAATKQVATTVLPPCPEKTCAGGDCGCDTCKQSQGVFESGRGDTRLMATKSKQAALPQFQKMVSGAASNIKSTNPNPWTALYQKLNDNTA